MVVTDHGQLFHFPGGLVYGHLVVLLPDFFSERDEELIEYNSICRYAGVQRVATHQKHNFLKMLMNK